MFWPLLRWSQFETRLEIKQKLYETMATFCKQLSLAVGMRSNAVNGQIKLTNESGTEIIWMTFMGSSWTLIAWSWIMICGPASPTASKNAASFGCFPCRVSLEWYTDQIPWDLNKHISFSSPLLNRPKFLQQKRKARSRVNAGANGLKPQNRVRELQNLFVAVKYNSVRKSYSLKICKKHGNIKNTKPTANQVLWSLR